LRGADGSPTVGILTSWDSTLSIHLMSFIPRATVMSRD
jgi:hypothetical protein